MLKFGTAGLPEGAKSYEHGFEMLKSMGLDGMEVEFVHGVRMKPDRAEEIGRLAVQSGLFLTCHGPYYVNLNAVDPEKFEASIRRVENTIEAGRIMGARSVTFHAGFYLKQDPLQVQERIRGVLKEIMDRQQAPGTPQVAPETTGKPTQYGELNELLQTVQGIPGMSICIDFAHLHARTNGRYNSARETEFVLEKVVQYLGEGALQRMHIHMAGIAYGPKGEKHHLNLAEADLNVDAIFQVLRTWDVSGVVICESPNLQADAMSLKETWMRL